MSVAMESRVSASLARVGAAMVEDGLREACDFGMDRDRQRAFAIPCARLGIRRPRGVAIYLPAVQMYRSRFTWFPKRPLKWIRLQASTTTASGVSTKACTQAALP